MKNVREEREEYEMMLINKSKNGGSYLRQEVPVLDSGLEILKL